MTNQKTIELYRILKLAEPHGDFSAYEKRIGELQKNLFDQFISSVCQNRNKSRITFLQPRENDVMLHQREIEEYETALTRLVDLCREYIKTGANIGNLNTAELFENGKLNLSSTSAVNSVISALQAAKSGGKGTYLTKDPLEVLLKPVTRSTGDSYERSFHSTLPRYLSSGRVSDNDVVHFLEHDGCTFVSNSFIENVRNSSNAKLSSILLKETKRAKRKLSCTIYLPIFFVLAAFSSPMFVLTVLDKHLSISGYHWILLVLAGVLCGFIPKLFHAILRDKLKVHQQTNSSIRMVNGPYILSAVFLVILLALGTFVQWYRKAETAPAVTAFAGAYFLFYIITVALLNRKNDCDVNSNNSQGFANTLFGLIKVLLPFSLSFLLSDHLTAYLMFNCMALATCVLYEILENADIHPVADAFLTFALALCFSLFLVSLLALCKLEGVYIFYLILFDFNATAMYTVSIIFMLILFAVGIFLTIFFYYGIGYRDGATGVSIAFPIILLAVSAIVFGVGFAKMKKVRSDKNSLIVDNCVLIVKDGTLQKVYGASNQLEIPSSVKSISSNVLVDSFSVKHLYVPDSVKTIEAGAFKNCRKLQSISLPYVSSSDDTYFGYMFGKKSYKGATAINHNSTYYFPSTLRSVEIRGGNVNSYAFANCSFLTQVVLGSNVKSIGESVFAGCNKLDSLTLPYLGSVNSGSNVNESVLLGSLFSKTFSAGCKAVTQVYTDSIQLTAYIPSTLHHLTILRGKIYRGALANCSMLQSVTLGEEVTAIGEAALTGCSALQNLTVPFIGSAPTPSSYTDRLFGYIFGTDEYAGGTETLQRFLYNNGDIGTITYYVPASLKHVTVLSGKTIAAGAFSNCASLESLALPNDVEKIGYFAFDGCNKLKKTVSGMQYVNNWIVGYEPSAKAAIVTPNTVGVADGALDGATTLESLSLPNSVKYLGLNAFRGCAIKNVNYQGTLEQWLQIVLANKYSSPVNGNLSFNGELLTSLEIPKDMETVPRYYFQNIQSIKTLVIPEGVVEMEDGAFSGCTGLTEIYYYATECSHLTQKSAIFAFGGHKSSGITVVIGNQVVCIPQYLFYTKESEQAPNLIKLTFARDSVCTTIEGYAFANCSSLKEATIPASVTAIHPFAFDSCTTLITTVDGIYYISDWAVGYEEGLTDAVIRGGTVGIADNAFADCTTLTSITVPASVINIGQDVFKDCTALTEVTLPYTLERYGIENFESSYRLKKFTCADGVFVRFIYFYNSSKNLVSRELLTQEQTISSSELFEKGSNSSSLFGGYYTYSSCALDYIKTSITSKDTGFIHMYPYYFSSTQTQTIASGSKSWSSGGTRTASSSVSFDITRMNKMRSYGFAYTFTLSYEAESRTRSSVTVKSSGGHTTDYKASFKCSYTMAYESSEGTISSTYAGPSLSVTLASSWFSGGSKSTTADWFVQAGYAAIPITGNKITLTSAYEYSMSLGEKGTATYTIPAVHVTVKFGYA